jgi:hypothetical protein
VSPCEKGVHSERARYEDRSRRCLTNSFPVSYPPFRNSVLPEQTQLKTDTNRFSSGFTVKEGKFRVTQLARELFRHT